MFQMPPSLSPTSSMGRLEQPFRSPIASQFEQHLRLHNSEIDTCHRMPAIELSLRCKCGMVFLFLFYLLFIYCCSWPASSP